MIIVAKLIVQPIAMGILGLSKLLQDVVPHAIKESEIKHYFGRYLYNLKILTSCIKIIIYFAQDVKLQLMHPCACTSF